MYCTKEIFNLKNNSLNASKRATCTGGSLIFMIEFGWRVLLSPCLVGVSAFTWAFSWVILSHAIEIGI